GEYLKMADEGFGKISLNSKLLRYIKAAQTKSDISDDLKQELKVIKNSKFNLDGGKLANIPFTTVRKLHKFLQLDSSSDEPVVYLHELLEESDICFPKLEVPERNPELEARIQRLKGQQANREYANMTKNLGSTGLYSTNKAEPSFGADVKALNSQLIGVANFLITVIAGFAFGYKIVEYNMDVPDFALQLCSGMIFATIIFIADLYFFIKNYAMDAEEPKVR
ncbi:unnamed protein product, partial [Owenia fusiformis]